MAIWRMRIACWITKATNTSSEYVIIIAFTLQQWLRERVSMLRLHVHCLSCIHPGCVLKSSGILVDYDAQIRGVLL
jgi:hypothetical protein